MTKRVLITPFSNLIREIGMKIKRIADERLNELGLNSQQGRMIGYIFENQDKDVIQKDLANEFNRKGASITSMLQGLEKKGFLGLIPLFAFNYASKNITRLKSSIKYAFVYIGSISRVEYT